MSTYKRAYFAVLFLLIGLVMLFLGFQGFITRVVYFNWLNIVILSVGVLSAALSVQMFMESRHSLPIAHSVAVVGFPGSGKTTLITAVFGEIFRQGMPGLVVRLRGQSTIDRVNEDLRKLGRGEALGPTRDQDVFAYRADVEIGGPLLRRTYKVEFGDFPGDESVVYSETYGPWLHTSPFFKWVSEADSLVFIVDLSRYLEDRPLECRRYVPDMSAAIRAAWQTFTDTIGVSAARRRPVVLAFTKADLLDVPEESERERNSNLDVESASRLRRVPHERELEMAALEAAKSAVESDFSDLITFLGSDVQQFRIVYTSSFGSVDGRRLGLVALFEAVLPRQRQWLPPTD